jgi:hypothetical protein
MCSADTRLILRHNRPMEHKKPSVPDDASGIFVVGDVTLPISDEETAEQRDWGEAMKRVQLLSDEELFPAVKDPHPGARCEALLRLRARCAEDPRTLQAISDAVRDDDLRVRETAVAKLRNLAVKRASNTKRNAILAIRRALKDPHEDVRAEARYSLNQLGEPPPAHEA